MTWRTGLPSNLWVQVAVNTLQSINPENNPALNPWYGTSGHSVPAPWNGSTQWSAITGAWSGGAWDEANQKLYIHGGGHVNDGSNAMVGLDCTNTAGPIFTLLRPPTGCIGNEGTLDDGLESTGKYFDGRPRSAHTYALLNVVSGNMWMWPMGSLYISGAGNVDRCWEFDTATNDWIDHGVPISGPYTETYSGTVYVPSLGELWHIPRTNTNWWRLNLSTLVATVANTDSSSSSAKQPVYDPVRNLVLFFGNYPTGFIIVDVTNPMAYSLTVPTISGSPPQRTCSEGLGGEGWAYNSVHDLFASLNNYDPNGAGEGTSITVLIPPTSSPLTNTWTWAVIDADPSNTVVPTKQMGGNGVYGRWFFSASLMGYGLVTDINTGMYFFPVSATYPTTRPLAGQTPGRISIGSTYYDTFQQAADAAGTSTVTVVAEPGLYYQAAKFSGSVTIQSSVPGERIKIDALYSIQTPSGEGTLVLYGATNVLTDVELTRGAYADDGGRGIFLHQGSLTTNNAWIHDCAAHGIQGCGDPAVDYSACDVVFNNSLFERCGGGSGQTHNFYFGRINSLTCNNTSSHDCNVGHLGKCRGANITIDGGYWNQGRASRMIDAPQGGNVEVKNAVICRNSTTGNNTDIIGYALEQDTVFWPTNTVNFRSTNQVFDENSDRRVVHVNVNWNPTVNNVESYSVISTCPISDTTTLRSSLSSVSTLTGTLTNASVDTTPLQASLGSVSTLTGTLSSVYDTTPLQASLSSVSTLSGTLTSVPTPYKGLEYTPIMKPLSKAQIRKRFKLDDEEANVITEVAKTQLNDLSLSKSQIKQQAKQALKEKGIELETKHLEALNAKREADINQEIAKLLEKKQIEQDNEDIHLILMALAV